MYSFPFTNPLTSRLVTSFPSITAFFKVPSAGVMLICNPAKSSSDGFFQVNKAYPSLAVTVTSVTSFGAVLSLVSTTVVFAVTPSE